jgi:acyl carrier protein
MLRAGRDNRMTDNEVIPLLKRALCWAKPQMATIADELDASTALADLGLESVALLEMAAFIEDKLQVEFADEQLVEIRSIADFISLIHAAHGSVAAEVGANAQQATRGIS